MHLTGFLFWGWLVILPVFQEPDTDKALSESIAAQHQRYIAALKQGDAAAYASLFTQDGVVLFPGDFQKGKSQLEQRQAQLFSQVRILEGTIHTLSLERNGPLAYEIGRFQYTIEVRADGSHRNLSGRYLAIWQQQGDGSWLMAVDSGFPDP